MDVDELRAREPLPQGCYAGAVRRILEEQPALGLLALHLLQEVTIIAPPRFDAIRRDPIEMDRLAINSPAVPWKKERVIEGKRPECGHGHFFFPRRFEGHGDSVHRPMRGEQRREYRGGDSRHEIERECRLQQRDDAELRILAEQLMHVSRSAAPMSYDENGRGGEGLRRDPLSHPPLFEIVQRRANGADPKQIERAQPEAESRVGRAVFPKAIEQIAETRREERVRNGPAQAHDVVPQFLRGNLRGNDGWLGRGNDLLAEAFPELGDALGIQPISFVA